VPVLAITGGIATGKSAFARRFQRLTNGRLFDADATAKELLEGSSDVREKVRAVFGPQVMDAGGGISRARLREIVFDDRARRESLEGILHPLIRVRWEDEAAKAREKGEWFLADIPLLYETGGETLVDHVVVVACARDTQIRRMRMDRGLSLPMAEAILRAQAPLDEKMNRASFVIWTDSPLSFLDDQARLLAACLEPI